MTDTSETTAPERTAPKNNAPIVNEPLIRKSTWTQERPPEDGIGLCLSGGGYRAMLFHIGSLWRLNELGLLAKIDRIASVSGGSITAATLGLAWKHLEWDANRERITQASLEKYFVAPLRAFARKTIDLTAIGWGIFSPFSTIGEQIAAAYDDALFHGATLQDLPDDWSKATPRTGGPRFVIVATNVRTGSLCRFAKP
jgi:NTE family protein